MIDDVVGTWISLNHMDGVLGHKRNGMSIALDDTEDRFVTRAAKKIWDDVGMSKLRDDAVSEVRSQYFGGSIDMDTRVCRRVAGGVPRQRRWLSHRGAGD